MKRKDCFKPCITLLFVCFAASLFVHCDVILAKYARMKHYPQGLTHSKSSTTRKFSKKTLKPLRHFDLNDPSLDQYNANAPTSMPPIADDAIAPLAPSYLHQSTPFPPYCIYPPSTPFPPSTPTPTPIVYGQPPPFSLNPPLPFQSPPPGFEPSPPEIFPGPPVFEPSPPEILPGPPGFEPSPPEYEPSPPGFEPSPPERVPSPPIFLPPIVFPAPAVPPPPYNGPGIPLWCVAKPTVPDPIIQEAMNYACGSGADCSSIQPNGACYNPDKLILLASFAFNSYWQRTKAAGGTCDFGGTAMLVTKDPSFDGCHFVIN